MSEAVDEARAVIEAMKKSQPGIHVEVLERGFAELWNQAQARQDDRRIIEAGLYDLETNFFANIPLGGPDPETDPNDEFKRCAVDRAERVKRARQVLRAQLGLDEAVKPVHIWADLLGVWPMKELGWDPAWKNELITRDQFLAQWFDRGLVVSRLSPLFETNR